MPTKLFVGNVSESCTEDDLKQAFEKYGPIVEHAIKRNYAFVHFEKKEDAETAIKELHESELKGNVIRVLLSTTPHKTGRGGGGGGRAPPYNRDRDRAGYQRGPPRRGYDRGYGPDGGGRYHPYDQRDYYRAPPYPPPYNSRASGSSGYGYYSSYESDYNSRDYYPARSYPSQYDDRGYGSGRAVTYPDVKRQWDR
ncbi:RNA-binding protein 4B [Acropora cervicornis]|uniref:RNA-binding protein 4B n=1 Tax=Acropora cervicornis TaxID=6130 RepID=A0AAD9PSJ8_ACRCE|nr:PREDICTED: RNA-binding protein 4B-like [Acropora digitifera]XP_029214429.1 RNA-binding protein 4B-like [Acropora millepora]KAK2548113.1 RNA-binding protein 4B [Acropora cervicornis]